MSIRCISLVLVMFAVWFGTARAIAQPGMGGPGGWGQMFDPAVTSKDIERYAEFLALSEDQVDAAKSLLEGYQDEFQRAAKEMRDASDAAREEFRDTRDFTVWEDLRPRMEAFQARRKELESSFLKDLKDLATPEQSEKWPALERLRRRETTMRRGLMSGESADVVALVEELKLDPQAAGAVRDLLSQYELELDRALIDRNERFESGMGRGAALWREGNMEALTTLFNEGREASIRVRDINRRFARQIEGALPDASRAKFHERFEEASFPRVYNRSLALRSLDAARQFNGLTPDQKAQIDELQQNHTRESAGLNQRWAQAIEENELKVTPMEMMGGGGSPAMREARQARRAVDDRTLEKLKSLLTPEQVEMLPTRGDRSDDEEEQVLRRRRREG